ncbi:hypothetical protein, partial [Enterococcus avium]|uniref:hypothetical protein n=1 Tax=Enterococcus avium TaxID=33945 RepID=UPI001F5A17C0
RSVIFNKKVNHTKSPPENEFSGGFLITFLFWCDQKKNSLNFELTLQLVYHLKQISKEITKVPE